MLAGLLFAHHDAEDRPERLVATLPFAGSSLIEHQARQLVAAGASQIVVVAPRLTPELLGALSRMTRPGVALDTVRSAGEAAGKLHPLSRILMLADGLVATDGAVGEMARDGGDALLVLDGEQAGPDFERVGGRLAWAGIARLGQQRVAEVAALPRDYDMQSALVRVLEQGAASHVTMFGEPARFGHGLARSEQAAAERGRHLMASFFAGRRNWFERWIVAPVAGWLLPPLMTRSISGAVVGAGAVLLAVVGALALAVGHGAAAMCLALATTLLVTIGTALARLRGEERAMRGQAIAAIAIPLAAILLLGWTARTANDSGPTVAAMALVVFAAMRTRVPVPFERWSGSPAAYLIPVALGAALGRADWGLYLAVFYAAATLADAIERWRGQG